MRFDYSHRHNDITEKSWEMEFHIPYITQNLISILKEEKNPYLFFNSFFELRNKLEGLPQYGILAHNLDWAEYYHGHNRMIHSYDVALLLERIGNNNGISKKEITKMILAWLQHDIATPARWDTAMKVLKDMKEEENFLKYMSYFPDFQKKMKSEFGVSVEELSPLIKNEGAAGKALDIADKFWYTLRDIDNLVPTRTAAHIGHTQHIEALHTLISQSPHLWDVVDDIVIDQNDIYFKNPEKLYDILLARAYMHNIVYLNAGVHNREHAVGLMIKFLLEKGELTKEELLLGKKNNTVLNDFFFIKYSEIDQIIPYNPLIFQEDFFEKRWFDTPEEREAYTQEFLHNHPEYQNLVFQIKTPKFKSWSQFIVHHEGTTKSLAEAMQGRPKLNTLESLAKNTEKHLLLYPAEEFMERKGEYPEFYNFLERESKKTVKG